MYDDILSPEYKIAKLAIQLSNFVRTKLYEWDIVSYVWDDSISIQIRYSDCSFETEEQYTCFDIFIQRIQKNQNTQLFFFRIAISITFSRPPLFFRRNALLLLLFSIILFFFLRRGCCFVFASSMILSREIDSFLSSIAISKLLFLHLSLVPYDSDRCIYFQRRLFPNALGNYSMQIEDKELW